MFIKVSQTFKLPSANSPSGDNKNLSSQFSISLIQDYLHLVLLSAPKGRSTMGHRLVGIHFICSQCFCPTLNGVTAKTIFHHNWNIRFKNATMSRVDAVVCCFSVMSDIENSKLTFLLFLDEEPVEDSLKIQETLINTLNL